MAEPEEGQEEGRQSEQAAPGRQNNKPLVAAQEQAAKELPASLPRFATHLEMHRGLMLSRSGDQVAGTAYAQSAMDALPPEKHSLTLRMLKNEISASPSAR